MPILPYEADVYPNDLLDPAAGSRSAGLPWWALHTMPRREKVLMRRLCTLQIAHYGPLVQRRRRSPGGRITTSFVPLFPSYVFLCGDEAARHEAVKTNCVFQCLAVGDPDGLVRDLLQIRRLIDSGVPLTPEATIETGASVRVSHGPLAGLEGIVLRRRGAMRLVVSVDFLQKGASVEIEDCMVQKIGDPLAFRD